MTRILYLLIAASLLASCDTQQASNEVERNQAETSQVDADSGENPADAGNAPTESVNADELVARSINGTEAANGEFDFKTQFPLLHGIFSNRPSTLNALSDFAQNILSPASNLDDEAVESLLKTRESLMTSMNSLLESWDQKTGKPAELAEVEKELQLLGMRPGTAEGMFIELVESPLPAQIRAACSPAFQAHLDFFHRERNTLGGEYPYTNMALFGKAVIAGESLMRTFPESKYAQQDDSLYRSMVDIFLGLYLRKEGDYTVPAMGRPGDDYHEFGLSEMDSHKAFVEEYPNSQYTPLVSALLTSPSTSDASPAELYIVYDEYFESEEKAHQHKHALLAKGKDVFHIIPVFLGNGKTHYLVSYRFYDSSEKATDFFTQKEKSDPNVKMMFTSANKGKFVQAGI
ncbi:MAG: hypothetical protein AB8F95_00175 [Bacteroidia bacterium]